ncbi:GGDEF domain-containing protein [Pseudodesulfovibrio sp. zrk46]|uniref:GGDEF domain-containing protein n=1 Tax=Pseudodesulfovibrio sp. zrk46 TaxID=2725288 RepID=UPI001449C9C6|nr:GGDEF domain-containing protein [Pseudodesulfovibrio sp. zrk46]QJB57252.1 GGDEF domain-containing protein [Pseudodesulfovibrio sp. zrk46]
MFRNLLESHFDLIPFQVYIADVSKYEIVFANKLLSDIYGDLRGKTCYKALHGINVPCDFCPIQHVLTEEGLPNDQTNNFEYFNEVEDCWYQVKARALGWTDGSIVTQFIRVDITDLKEIQSQLAETHAMMALQNKKLEQISSTDPLTGLANRLRLDEAMKAEKKRAKQQAKPLSIIMTDIDHFKSVNDTYGHTTGDRVLKRIASILANSVRREDIPGRWGGEEFLIIMRNTDIMGATQMAEGLRRQIEAQEFPKVGQKTASFGVAQLKDDDTLITFVNRADAALYKAKETGRNKVVSQ